MAQKGRKFDGLYEEVKKLMTELGYVEDPLHVDAKKNTGGWIKRVGRWLKKGFEPVMIDINHIFPLEIHWVINDEIVISKHTCETGYKLTESERIKINDVLQKLREIETQRTPA